MDTNIARYINKNLVFFMTASSRDEVLSFCAKKIALEVPEFSPEVLEKAIFQREKLMSTGIGMGIAIPHAKVPGFPRFVIAIGIFGRGVDWNAIDSSLVRLAFMIIGPDNAPDEYLQILSSITNAMRSEDMRRKLLSARSSDTIVKILSEIPRETP